MEMNGHFRRGVEFGADVSPPGSGRSKSDLVVNA